MRRFSSVALIIASLVACRSDNNGNGTDANGSGGSDSNPGGTVTIQMVQSDTMAPGTPVSLSGVVVTAIDTFGAKTGNFWVEEPEGGQFSGVLVFNAPVDQVAALSVGDTVNLTGAQKEEFALSSDTSGNTDTELGPPSGGMITVTKTGSGTVPPPVVVDALMIGQMSGSSARNTAWEPYEGVLITLTNVAALSAAKDFGSGDLDQVSFEITGTADVESEMAQFPGEMAGSGSGSANPGTVKRGECFTNLTGVLDYFFTYNLLPRSAADIGADGTSCPPAEQAANDGTIGTCGDSLDNDGNGFADCADLGCEVGSNAWVDAAGCDHATTGTCGCSQNEAEGGGDAAINTGASGTTAPVILNNVVVTAVSKSGFWVADAGQAASNGGLFVFGATTTPTIGQKIATLQGLPKPFNPSKVTTSPTTIIELNDPTVGTATGGGAPKPVASTAAVVGDLAGGASFASAYVQLSLVKVQAQGSFNQVTLVDNAGKTIVMDDSAFFDYSTATPPVATLPAVGTCFKTLSGVMSLTTSDSAGMTEVRTINPTGAADMVTGTGCN